MRIDLGISGLCALLVDVDGEPKGSVERENPTYNLHQGWFEQDPADWLDALETVVQTLRADDPEFAAIKGIGVSGPMHGVFLIGDHHRLIGPCIFRNDTRSHREAAGLVFTADFRAASGAIDLPGLSAPNLRWLRTHEPEKHVRMARMVLPAGYINRYLTGEYLVDLSDSAGTSLLDIGTRYWSQTLLEARHKRHDQIPRLVDRCAPAGQPQAKLARAWGLTGPVIVADGAGDNAAASCIIGALSVGQGVVSPGTSGELLMAHEIYQVAPETALHSFCQAVPGRWYQMGVMLSAARSLNWLSGIGGQSPTALTQALGKQLLPPGPERFFPYLSGVHPPPNDAGICTAFTGPGTQATLADMPLGTGGCGFWPARKRLGVYVDRREYRRITCWRRRRGLGLVGEADCDSSGLAPYTALGWRVRRRRWNCTARDCCGNRRSARTSDAPTPACRPDRTRPQACGTVPGRLRAFQSRLPGGKVDTMRRWFRKDTKGSAAK